MFAALSAIVFAHGPVTPVAQAPGQFEVASGKPNVSGDAKVAIQTQPGGRFTATNVTLRQLIRSAYQLQEFQVTGGPNWLDRKSRALGLPPVDRDGPALVTAVREQLGLKIDSQKGPVDVLVVDRAERPKEN